MKFSNGVNFSITSYIFFLRIVSCRFLNLLYPTFLTPQRVLGEEVNYLVYKNFSTALHCSFIFFAFFNQFHGQKKLATWI